MANRDRDRSTVAAIKNLILDRGLMSGDPMPTESELMDELDISRSSVREAVRTLVALDILSVRHGTGTFVGTMSLRPLVDAVVFRGVHNPDQSMKSLRDVVEIRMGLDVALAPRIVALLADTNAHDLADCADLMTGAAVRGETFLPHDRRFHLLLAERLGNQLYAELVGAFWDIHRTIAPRLGVASKRDLADTAAAHVAMLDAAVSGDLDRYVASIDLHYAPLLRALDRPEEIPRAS